MNVGNIRDQSYFKIACKAEYNNLDNNMKWYTHVIKASVLL